MQFSLDLHKAPTVVYLTVKAQHPISLALVGFDAGKSENPNRFCYFAREIKIDKGNFPQERKIELMLPQAPEKLTVEVSQLSGTYFGEGAVKITGLETKPLQGGSLILFPKGSYEFVKFIQKFAEKVGDRSDGFFVSKDENYIIWLKPSVDTTGTPAKINRRTGVMKVDSTQFHKYTIPMRIFIMLHEFFHWKKNTDDEIQADTGALKLYLALKYPKSEANYAMTKVFSDNAYSRQRMDVMDKIIKNSENRYFA